MRDCLPCGALTRKAALSNLRQQPECLRRSGFQDLSLGAREERTRNAAMRQVGQNIREMDSCYKNSEKIECVLEWNKGNHFQDVDVRCGKGFLWCMGENICKINNCKTNRDRTMV